MPALLLSLVSVTAIACGDSGPSDSAKLLDLSQSEAKELCLETVDAFPERMVTCSGQTFTIGAKASDCEGTLTTDATCTATVGQARDCFDALAALTDAQICAGGAEPAACAVLEGC